MQNMAKRSEVSSTMAKKDVRPDVVNYWLPLIQMWPGAPQQLPRNCVIKKSNGRHAGHRGCASVHCSRQYSTTHLQNILRYSAVSCFLALRQLVPCVCVCGKLSDAGHAGLLECISNTKSKTGLYVCIDIQYIKHIIPISYIVYLYTIIYGPLCLWTVYRLP